MLLSGLTCLSVDTRGLDEHRLAIDHQQNVARQRDAALAVLPRKAVGQIEGLAEGDQVVLHPGDTLADGARVRPAR